MQLPSEKTLDASERKSDAVYKEISRGRLIRTHNVDALHASRRGAEGYRRQTECSFIVDSSGKSTRAGTRSAGFGTR